MSGHSTYEPKSGFERWLDTRLPILRFANDTIVTFPPPKNLNYCWLVQFMHANGASMFFLAVYIHIFRNLYYGSYKAPREVLWILGCVIYLLMMATGFFGYVLPWGQMSFHGAVVITNVVGSIPLIGPAITTWLWGGFAVDDPTLNRFFSLHY